MERVADLLLVIILSYLAGSFPTSLILGKLFKNGTDLREQGSGNTGATNSFRVLGWKIGLAVALIDIFKGYAAAKWIVSISPLGGNNPEALLYICSTLAVVGGHIYPVFSGFRGGRGFGAAVGAVLAYFPLAGPVCLLVFLVTLGITGYVSVCAFFASLALPLFYYLTPLITGQETERAILLFFLITSLLTAFSTRKKLLLYYKGEADVFEKARIIRKKRRIPCKKQK